MGSVAALPMPDAPITRVDVSTSDGAIWHKPMEHEALQTEIAEATKRYVREQWRLDIATFGRTQDRAWAHLAGRILDRPGAVMPVNPSNRLRRA